MKKFQLNRALAAKKKIVVIYLLVVAGMVLRGSCAYGKVYEGVCGEHLTWSYDTETAHMTIEGYG